MSGSGGKRGDVSAAMRARLRLYPSKGQGTKGSRHGRGRELFASCACGNGRPHHLFFRKRWCRLAVPEKNRRGSRCLLPLLKQKSTPDTPTGRVGIAPVKPPLCKGRCPRSGRRDCLAGFRLPAGFPRGGGAFSLRYVGVQGAFHLPVEHYGFTPPGAFSLGPLQRPVLFSREKRMGGWEAPLLEGVKSAAFGRIEKLGRAWRGNPPPPAGETFVPARGGNLSSGARNRSLPRGNPALRRFWDDNPSGGRAASSLYTREPYRVRLRRKAKKPPRGRLFLQKRSGALTPPDFWYTAPGWR